MYVCSQCLGKAASRYDNIYVFVLYFFFIYYKHIYIFMY